MRKIILLVSILLLNGCRGREVNHETFSHEYVETIEVENIKVETIEVETIHVK